MGRSFETVGKLVLVKVSHESCLICHGDYKYCTTVDEGNLVDEYSSSVRPLQNFSPSTVSKISREGAQKSSRQDAL